MAKTRKATNKRKTRKRNSSAIQAVAKRPVGRPKTYKPDFARQAQVIVSNGFTEARLAQVFKVRPQTISEWKQRYPEFAEAIKQGKDDADDVIAGSLYHRAKGYSHPDTYVSQYRGEIITKPITKHYPPDTAAAFIWLKNRRPGEWRDRIQVESEGLEGFLALIGGRTLVNATERKQVESTEVRSLPPAEDSALPPVVPTETETEHST